MRRAAVLAFALGCGSHPAARSDAAIDAPADAAVDARPDAPPDAACKKQLLVGGMDVIAQGWHVVAQPVDTLSNGSDYVELHTSTPTNAPSGGELLLAYGSAFAPNAPFSLEVVEQVVQVSLHNQLDAAAAIMGSLTGANGTAQERGEMVYLDPTAVGWGDDSQSFAFGVVDGNYHTFVLSVDAAGAATFTVDGAMALTRQGYTSSGTIAIGDQTNDPNVDATTRYRSVVLSQCP
jgi:hypothetical protein